MFASGYASMNIERLMSDDFIAAIVQEAEGDVSPNTAGPKCPDGTACDARTSTCKKGVCIASGPGKDMFESTKMIGQIISQKIVSHFSD